jgi:hypothetical protein
MKATAMCMLMTTGVAGAATTPPPPSPPTLTDSKGAFVGYVGSAGGAWFRSNSVTIAAAGVWLTAFIDPAGKTLYSDTPLYWSQPNCGGTPYIDTSALVPDAVIGVHPASSVYAIYFPSQTVGKKPNVAVLSGSSYTVDGVKSCANYGSPNVLAYATPAQFIDVRTLNFAPPFKVKYQ